MDMPVQTEALNTAADSRFRIARSRVSMADFAHDAQFLRPGSRENVTVGAIGMPVAERGKYSIRIITPDMERSKAREVINNARVVVFTCMEERTAEPLVNSIIASYEQQGKKITHEEIAVIRSEERRV